MFLWRTLTHREDNLELGDSPENYERDKVWENASLFLKEVSFHWHRPRGWLSSKHQSFRPMWGNPESGKFLLLESAILGFGIRNTVQGIWNRTNDWNSESKFYWQRLESSTWNSQSTAWNPESKIVPDSLKWGETLHIDKNWDNRAQNKEVWPHEWDWLRHSEWATWNLSTCQNSAG